MRPRLAVPLLAVAAVLSAGCAGPITGTALAAHTASITGTTTSAPPTTTAAPTTTAVTTTSPPPPKAPPPPPPPAAPASAGNSNGHAAIPAVGQPLNTAHPDHVIGTGTAASCTSQAVIAAVAAGGVITFSCGPVPVTITLTATAKIHNTSPTVVIDGGGRVTLSGAGARRILYQDTCDTAQGKVSSDCHNQAQPKLTVQNMAFASGNSTGQTTGDGGGGGAIFALGGRLTVINSRFENNRCDTTGPDLGGAGIRALNQYQNQPVYVVDSTFTGGACSNGGGLSSIGVSWVVLNSVFTGNTAIGNGANPASPGTPGGGSGGAIYTDGDTYTLRLAGCLVQGNHANEGGGAVFYVSNDHTGTMSVEQSTLSHDVSASFETAGFPGIFFIGSGKPVISGSTLTR
jgi:hypothetical protein